MDRELTSLICQRFEDNLQRYPTLLGIMADSRTRRHYKGFFIANNMKNLKELFVGLSNYNSRKLRPRLRKKVEAQTENFNCRVTIETNNYLTRSPTLISQLLYSFNTTRTGV